LGLTERYLSAKYTLGTRLEAVGPIPVLSNEWLIDSGASNHFTSKKDILTNFTNIAEIPIKTGKGQISARGMGDVIVQLPAPFGPTIIKGVMWCPELQGYSNLLSVPQLTKKGFAILFEAFYLDVYNKPMMHIPPNQHLFARTGHTALLSGTTDTPTPKNQAYRYTRKIYQLPHRIQHDQIDIRSNSQHARRRIDFICLRFPYSQPSFTIRK